MLAWRLSTPLQTGKVTRPKTAALATSRRPSSRNRRARLQVVSYRSEMSDKLLKAATQYARITGEAGGLTAEEVASRLEPLVAPCGVTFLADNVIHHHDRSKDVSQLVDSLARQHDAYEHLVYRPVVSAVHEDSGVVFTAIYFVLQNRGPVLGATEPTRRVSKGFLIDKMTFDKDGLLESSLVARPLTLEERDALLENPTCCQPAEVDEGELVAVPNVVAVPNDYTYMGEIISKWTGMWSTGAPLDELSKVVAPNCRAHDGYGLSNKPNGILWQGLDQARAIITSAQNAYDNKNQLLSYAVSYDHKLAFHHWQANVVDCNGRRAHPLQGLGLICFNEHLQIRDIYDFCMREYSSNLIWKHP